MSSSNPVAETAPSPLSEAEQKRLRRSVVAGTLGTMLEYYDYVIYALATALIFNVVFFTNESPAVAVIASAGTYAVGFAARPIGGLILGGLGDRIGRKRIMVITVMMMGFSTFAIGLLPTYAQIGAFAPVLLVLCRIVQGFGAGAELASTSSLLVESAPVKRRGVIGSLISFGTNGGSLIATGVWLLVTQLPEDQLLSWGWRLPFLISIVIAAFGFWLRRSVQESDVFESVAENQQRATLGQLYRGLFSSGWRSLLVCFGLRVGEGGTSVLYQVYIVGYVATLAGASAATGTLALLIASLVGIVSIPLIGMLSDRFGRRSMFLVLAGLQVVFAFPGIMLISTGEPWAIFLAFVIASGIAVQGMYALESSYMAEMFGSRHRLAGIVASKELGGLAGAGIAPLVAASLMAATGQIWVIGVYIAVLASISFIAALRAPETKGRDLTLREDAL